jgi:hypothetical protein
MSVKKSERRPDMGMKEQKKHRVIQLLINFTGLFLLFCLLEMLFTNNVFGSSTNYVQGILITACYTIIMVASLNLVVGFMGEFSMGHAGFVSIGAYMSALASSALAGKGLSDLGLLLTACLIGGLAAGAARHSGRHSGAAAARRLPRDRNHGVCRDHSRVLLQFQLYRRRAHHGRYPAAVHIRPGILDHDRLCRPHVSLRAQPLRGAPSRRSARITSRHRRSASM